MYRLLLVAIVMAPSIAPSFAQEPEGSFEFNKDRFLAGSTVVQDVVGVDDLFMVGETIQSNQDITGSAHLAGRNVASSGAIGGDAYITGMKVTIKGKVSGDLTVGGYTVQIDEVAGDLRASGDTLILSGPISGYALVSGDDVTFESVVEGDVSLAADTVDFSDDARIEGQLILYEKQKGTTEVPAQVIPEERIERRDISQWSEATSQSDGVGSKVFKFVRRVLFLTVLAVVIAGVRPQKLTDLRRSILGQPLRNIFFGVLALALALGVAILLLFTGVGFSLAVTTLLLALVAAFAGYVLGTYAIGVGLLQFAKRPEPDTLGSRAVAAVIGAVTISIIAMVPYLGVFSILAVSLIGIGSIVVRLFRPKLLEAA